MACLSVLCASPSPIPLFPRPPPLPPSLPFRAAAPARQVLSGTTEVDLVTQAHFATLEANVGVVRDLGLEAVNEVTLWHRPFPSSRYASKPGCAGGAECTRVLCGICPSPGF